jgi:hypothetical protein
MPFPNIGPGELILILIIALVVLGPRQAPRRRLVPGQERPRVPQGGHGRHGRRAARYPGRDARGPDFGRAGGPGARRAG